MLQPLTALEADTSLLVLGVGLDLPLRTGTSSHLAMAAGKCNEKMEARVLLGWCVEGVPFRVD